MQATAKGSMNSTIVSLTLNMLEGGRWRRRHWYSIMALLYKICKCSYNSRQSEQIVRVWLCIEEEGGESLGVGRAPRCYQTFYCCSYKMVRRVRMLERMYSKSSLHPSRMTMSRTARCDGGCLHPSFNFGNVFFYEVYSFTTPVYIPIPYGRDAMEYCSIETTCSSTVSVFYTLRHVIVHRE